MMKTKRNARRLLGGHKSKTQVLLSHVYAMCRSIATCDVKFFYVILPEICPKHVLENVKKQDECFHENSLARGQVSQIDL